MKTAISIPDKLFAAAEREAKRRGVSRSKLYQTALEEMIAKKRGAALTGRINKTIAQHGDPSEGEEAWLEMSEKTARERSEWNVRSKKNETGRTVVGVPRRAKRVRGRV